jgi:hypothetical protein
MSARDIDGPMDLLFISAEQFHRKPQVGTPVQMSWADLADYLSRPSIGDRKGDAGGYSPALYRENIRRKANLVHIWALIVDIDGNGDVDRIADELAAYDAITHETFSSTNDDPRCRLVLRLARPIDWSTYERAHGVVRAILRRDAGAITDDGAKDASRLSYAPVRRAEAGYRFRLTSGRPLDAQRLVDAIPPPPPRPRIDVKPEHADAYRRGAMRRAAEAVASASDGARHETLNREAYALARLDLSIDAIRDALLPGAVAAMGESRRREAERTIADAVHARKGGA